MSHYIVMHRQAKMPSSCWGCYGIVAVVEVESPDTVPKMLSERARGVVRIVRQWGPDHMGKTSRSAYRQSEAEAEALCRQLNAEAVT